MLVDYDSVVVGRLMWKNPARQDDVNSARYVEIKLHPTLTFECRIKSEEISFLLTTFVDSTNHYIHSLSLTAQQRDQVCSTKKYVESIEKLICLYEFTISQPTNRHQCDAVDDKSSSFLSPVNGTSKYEIEFAQLPITRVIQPMWRGWLNLEFSQFYNTNATLFH